MAVGPLERANAAGQRTTITCFGEALIDFLAVPSGGAGAPRQFVEHPGGAPANVAVGVARLGGHASFAGMLSTDMFGDVLLHEFTRLGVDVAQVRRTDAARTALAFVSLDEHGERSFSFYRPPAADLLFSAHDFDDAAVANSAIFHVCSNSLVDTAIADSTLHGMHLAANGGALVSMDLNLRPSLWPRAADPAPVAWRALQRAHLIKLSREELAFLASDGDEDAAIAKLFAHAARAVVVTDGAAAVRWWTRDGSGSLDTFAVQAVDTTAAGDAFVAGLLQGLVMQAITPATLADAFASDDLRHRVLRQASAAGALATTRHGAFAAMPTLDEVRELTGDRAR